MGFDFEGGEVLLIDKPQGWTSFDVVNKLRYATKVKKIGHAGTLDPLATGLLILCTGKLTKRIDEYQAQEKEYTGSFVLGKTTPSFDSETEPDAEFPFDHINEAIILKKVQQFEGIINQVPPIYSAIKVNGKKLYELARKGKTVDIPSRQVTVEKFEIVSVSMPEVTFRIVCSKGTYIRSLVHDLGKALDSGAYMNSLRRTRIGEFSIDQALSVSAFLENLAAHRQLFS